MVGMFVFDQPKSAGCSGVVYGTKEASVCWGEVCGQGQGGHAGQVLVAAWGVGKLDCDRVQASLRNVVVQLLNCTFSFASLIKANESNTLRKSWKYNGYLKTCSWQWLYLLL